MRVKKEFGVARTLIERYKSEYKLSQRELAKWCGVNYCVVSQWALDKLVPREEHLDRLKEVQFLLAGRTIRYPKQAFDILMGKE